MGDEEAKVLEAAKKLPWEERLSHKNWKARVAAYSDVSDIAGKAYDGSNPALKEFGSYAGKAVMDSNANAQVKALETLVVYLQRIADENYVSRAAQAIVAAMVSKCLNGRPNTVKLVGDCCNQFVELEGAEAVTTELLKSFGNKVPKVVVAGLETLLSIVSLYGATVIPPKPILKALPPIFDHKDVKVREAAKELTVELAMWVGQPVVSSLLLEKMTSDAMKGDVQKKLDGCEGMGKARKPERLTRAAAAKAAAATAAKGQSEHGAAAEEEEEEEAAPVLDTYDLSEPQDVLSELNKSKGENGPFWKGIKEAKWSIRRDALKELQTLADVPKIASGDYGELGRALKKLIGSDGHVVVVGDATLCAAFLSKGLRKEFREQARLLTPVILDKFKDKQTLVVRNCHAALSNFVSFSYSLAEVVEDIQVALAHKVPKVKTETCRYLEEAATSLGRENVQPALKPLMPTLMKVVDDPDGAVRTQALAAVAAVARACGGMASIGRYVENLDDKKKKALEEAVGLASKGAPAPAPTSKAPAAKTKAPAALAPRDMNGGGSGASDKNAKKPAAAKSGSAGGRKLAGPAQDEQENLQAPPASKEQIEEYVAEVVGAQVVQNVKSEAWKERLEGAGALDAFVEEQGAGAAPHVEMLVGMLAPILSSDKNLQVTCKVIEILTKLAGSCDSFGKRHCFQCMDGVLGQLGGNIRSRMPSQECLTTFCEVSGPGFMLKELPKKASKNTNPKVLQECLNWMSTAMQEFGINGVDVKGLIATLKESLDSSAPATRTGATKVLGVLYTFVGPGLMDFLSDLKPALLTTIEAEFKKNGYDAAIANAPPKRTVRTRKKAAAPAAGGEGGGAQGGEVENDEDDGEGSAGGGGGGFSLPAEDISASITPQLMKELGGSDWKLRAASLENVDVILRDANRRIGPEVGDLLSGLKARLGDTNKNLVATTVTTFANIAVAMGPPIERQTRGYMAELFKCLSDSKKQVRDAAVRSLDPWASAIGHDKVVGHLAEALAMPKCSVEAKVEGLVWLTASCASCGDVTSMVKMAALACGDKSSQVRSESTKLFEALIAAHGSLSGSLKALSQAQRKTVEPVLAKLGMPAAAAAALAPTPSAAGPTPSGKKLARGSSAPVSRSMPARAGGAVTPRSRVPETRASAVTVGAGGGDGGGGATLLFNGEKEKRQKQTRGLKNKYEDPRPDMVEELKPLFAPYLRDDLPALMFCADFRKHAQAADHLMSGFADDLEPAISNLDLIFRWSVLRLVESNTTSLLKTLEMLSALLEGLKEMGYRLTEVEAMLLFPSLLEKSGHNIVQVREKYRQLVWQSCGVYPVSKLIQTFITESFNSKNNRTRTESIESMQALIEKHGLDQTKGLKALPSVVDVVANKKADAALRQTALTCLASVYKTVGEDVWRHLGKMSEPKVKAAIDDKFKWVAKQMEKSGEGRPGQSYQPSNYAKDAPSSPGAQGAGSSPQRSSGLIPPGQHPRQVQLPLRNSPLMQEGQARYGPQGGAGGPHSPNSTAAGYNQRAEPHQAGVPSSSSPPLSAVRASDANTHAHALQGLQRPPAPNPARTPQREVPDGLQDSCLSSAMAAPTPMMHGQRSYTAAGQQGGHGEGARPYEVVAKGWNQALEQISSQDEVASVDGMKLCCAELAEAASDRSSQAARALFVADADRLVALLTAKSGAVFADGLALVGKSPTPPSSRPCKYVLNTLMQAFQLPALAQSVAEPTLRQLAGELLLRLLDDRVPRLEEGTALLKALNILMLKILENGKRNYSFSCLLLLLRVPPPQVSDDAADGHHVLRSKFCDLVVKCLIKLTKALSASLQEVDLDMLLLSIHQFFMGLGVDEIRRRGQEDDKPLRMVKTVLHELCKLKGPAIKSHVTLIPPNTQSNEPAPIIHAYIDLNLQSLSSAGLVGGGTPGGAGAGAVGASPGLVGRQLRASANAPAARPAALSASSGQDLRTSVLHKEAAGSAPGGTKSPRSDLKQELASVFKKIGDKDSTSAGLEELYHFTKMHPGIDITPHLSKTSEAFRIYIKRGLEKVEESYRGGQRGVGAARASAAAKDPSRSPSGQHRDLIKQVIHPDHNQNMAVHPAADSSGLPPRAPHSDTSDPVSASSSASVGAGGSGGPTVRTSSSSLDAIKERMERINLSVRQSSAGPRPATAPAPPAQAAMGNGDVSTAGVHAKGGESEAPPRKPAAPMSMAELKERMARLQSSKK